MAYVFIMGIVLLMYGFGIAPDFLSVEWWLWDLGIVAIVLYFESRLKKDK